MIGHVSMIYICVVCCLLCVVYAQQATEVGKNVTAMAASCPRDVARRVRDYLFDDIFSALSISAMDLPPSCPLHPSRDLYGDQEKHKYEVHRGEWRCSYCNKRFVSEFYMDRHMEKMHPEHLNHENNAICLADYCDMFGCKVNAEDREVDTTSGKKKFITLEKCSEQKVKQLKQDCLHIAQSCFGQIGYSERFKSQVCESIKCVKGVFQGGIKPKANKSPSFIFRMLRFVFALLLLVIALVHMMFSDIPFLSYFSIRKTDPQGNKRNFFEQYTQKTQNNAGGSLWFFSSIRDAFSNTVRDFLKARQGKAN